MQQLVYCTLFADQFTSADTNKFVVDTVLFMNWQLHWELIRLLHIFVLHKIVLMKNFSVMNNLEVDVCRMTQWTVPLPDWLLMV